MAWTLGNTLLGALGGAFLAWGPLEGDGALVVASGLTGGLAGGGLWLR